MKIKKCWKNAPEWVWNALIIDLYWRMRYLVAPSKQEDHPFHPGWRRKSGVECFWLEIIHWPGKRRRKEYIAGTIRERLAQKKKEADNAAC